jgi:hypothetical protein
MSITRRSAIVLPAGLAAVSALAERRGRVDGPPLAVERSGGGFLLRNGLSGEAMRLDGQAPLFAFASGAVGGSAAGAGEWQRTATGWLGRWQADAAALELEITEATAAGLCRLRAAIRPAKALGLLRSVTIAAADASGMAPIARTGWMSYPVLCRSFFAGVEFPVATTRLEGESIVLSHAPAVRPAAGERFVSRTAVIGATRSGRSREEFLAYCEALRPKRPGLHFNYNSWWTSPVPYTEFDILKILEEFRYNLYEVGKVAPDSFTIDMGWAKNDTLWTIDPALFPEGFGPIRDACAAMGSNPGLWISPSGVYGQALDLAWAKKAGYEADAKACLGGPRYRQAFTRSLVDMTTRYGLRQVKLDGYVPSCDAADHGHEPGQLSIEPIADGFIRALEAVRAASPEIWLEPTCFGPDPSPWWYAWCDSVTGAFGDDSPPGRVPCPTYRQSATTGRDYYNLRGQRDILMPIAGQEVLGILHQTGEAPEDDMVTTVLRGNRFISLYVNPKVMNPERWRFLGSLMAWAKRNQAILGHTRPILPQAWRDVAVDAKARAEAAMPRQPYGYGHWHEGRGLVCLRNPWIEATEVTIDLQRDLGAPPDAAGLAVRSIYPETRLVATDAGSTSPLRVSLRPYETLLLELDKRQGRLPAPRPVYTAPAQPGLTVRASRFEAVGGGPRFAPDATRLLADGDKALRVRLSGVLETGGGRGWELAILAEGPAAVAQPFADIRIDGKSVTPTISGSAQGWKATGLPDPEHWVWLTVPVQGRAQRIEADVMAGGEGLRVSAWLVQRAPAPRTVLATGRPLAIGPGLPQPAERWLCSLRLFGSVGEGDLPQERGEGPVERIDGVYLDTVEPEANTQGYGTLQRNQSVWEKPMMVGGRSFQRGVGTHAPARTVYNLDGKWRRFTAWAGADQATGPTITMEVRVDGKPVWKSPGVLTRESAAQRVDVSLKGAKELELIVGDGGNGLAADHADWADAILHR